MSASDPYEPHTTLTTTNDVQVFVRDLPLPQPRPEPPPPERRRVVITPPEPPPAPPLQANPAHDAFIRELVEQHGEFLRRTLLRHGDVLEESAKDLQQRVFMIVREHVEKDAPPENIRGFLVAVAHHVIANHKREWRPEGRRAAEPDDMADETSGAPNPERTAHLAELRARLARYVGCLRPEEAEVIRCILVGMSIDETAAALQRPRGTVSTQLTSARDKLAELAHASDRATELGERRRSGR